MLVSSLGEASVNSVRLRERLSIELLERDGVAGANLALELVLRGLDDPFHQTARLRLPRRAVQQFDVQMGAGQSQTARMVDFRVVDVQLPTGAVNSPGAEQVNDVPIQIRK